MKTLALIFTTLFLSANVAADISINGMDNVGDWYLHVDLQEMRSAESGKKLYAWLDGEVFAELREETGFDLDKDIDHIIATSDGRKNVILVMNGTVRQEHKDQIMALAATQNVELAPRENGGREYFFMEGNGEVGNDQFNDGAYFSFAVKNKVILTSSESTMQRLLADGGNIALRNKGSMLTLMAENAMMTANESGESDSDWNSNIVKNTEQAAVVISDADGKIAVKTELVAREAKMAESLASIVRGLISLQAFNSDIEPDLAAILRSVSVDVIGKTLAISVALDADTVIDNL